MQKSQIFAYQWHIDDKEENTTCIRIYGLNEKEENVCVRINDFTPYIYVELPPDKTWNTNNTQMLCNKIDDLMGIAKPIKKCLEYKYKLYNAYIDKKGHRIKFPFLMLSFSCKNDIWAFKKKFNRPVNVIGLGRLKLKVHEDNASPILQFVCHADIPMAGWLEFTGRLITSNRKTRCEKEYIVKWKNIHKSSLDTVAKPLIMGYDIEAYSTVKSRMPKATNPGDKIFQISCVVARQGTPEETWTKYLLSLGNPLKERCGENVIVKTYKTEGDLLLGFSQLMIETRANIIVGYNIFGFDIPYMIARAKQEFVYYEFAEKGLNLGPANETTIEWSSSAYGKQKFLFLDAEGRLFVDLLPLVQRDYKMANYKLDTIAKFFLKETKKDLSHKGIFRCYELGMKDTEKGRRALAICGDYCVQDSVLVVKLMEKLQTWIGLTEMAKTCNVRIFDLYTRGQQLKVFSQIYKECLRKKFVVQRDGYIAAENEHYKGAYVFEPTPGVYDKVVPLDFASLYPRTIIAWNIDYSTYVLDESIPDSKCNVFEWDEHENCEHDPKMVKRRKLTEQIILIDDKLKQLRSIKKRTPDIKKQIDSLLKSKKPLTEERADINKKKGKFVLCGKRKFRFLKEPMGIMPKTLTSLLDARANTRKHIKPLVAKLKDSSLSEQERKDIETQITVLDKRQLSYKVSCNSMYGIMGVKKGSLPFMPGAMCTTARGRESIELAAKTVVEKFGGKLIYGDSVTEDTPVLCKINGSICYRTIDQISQNDWKTYHNTKEIATPLDGIEIWSDKGFTTIKHVIRHKTNKDIFRVVTKGGVVDVTEDHGLLDPVGNKVSPKNLENGNRLLVSELPGKTSYKTRGIIHITNKLEAAKEFYNANNAGRTVTISDDGECVCIQPEETHFVVDNSKIVNIINLGKTDKYVYDIETENHHFSAGIGKLIVHNTDSNYVYFPHLTTAQEIWDYAIYVAEEITKLYPSPMKLEFEDIIYWRFLILTKKRYMSLACKRDGIVSDEIQKKGVLLTRRDNCKFIRDLYGEVVLRIFHRENREDILYYIIQQLNRLEYHDISYNDFVVTKKVGDINGLKLEPYIENNVHKAKIGQYTVNLLPRDKKEKEKKLADKKASTEKEYYTRCLPAQVQLGEKMKRRGQRVDNGSRLEYIISSDGTLNGHKLKQFEKIEHIDYFKKHAEVLKTDNLYYLKLLSNPLDQLLNTLYKHENSYCTKIDNFCIYDENNASLYVKDFALKQYKHRKLKKQMHEELISHFQPKITFV